MNRTHKEQILDFLWAVAPRRVSNADIRAGTGISSAQQVYLLTHELWHTGLIQGESVGRESRFWADEAPDNLLTSLGPVAPGVSRSQDAAELTPQDFTARAQTVLSAYFGVTQLWGGLLLLQTPGVARALEEPPAAEGPAASVVLIPHATCTSAPGRSGIAVLASDFVAFIPAELRDDSVEVAVEMVFSFLPYSAPRAIRPEPPLETVLPRLAALPPERCAMHLRYLAAHHDGVCWQNESATRVEAHTVGRAHALALRFTVGDVALSVTVAPSQKPDVERLLAHWQPGDAPTEDSRCG